MPKRIRDLATGNATQGHFIPVDPTTGSTYKAALGQASGITLLDGAGIPLDSAGRRVVTSGSNSNGNFVRFSDGTQICWALHPESTFGGTFIGDDPNYRYRIKIWTFPAAFASNPSVAGSGDVTGGRVDTITCHSASTTQAAIEVGQYNTTAVSFSVVYSMAIGRWY